MTPHQVAFHELDATNVDVEDRISMSKRFVNEPANDGASKTTWPRVCGPGHQHRLLPPRKREPILYENTSLSNVETSSGFKMPERNSDPINDSITRASSRVAGGEDNKFESAPPSNTDLRTSDETMVS